MTPSLDHSDPNALQSAWRFAATRHADQKVPGSSWPYLTHIGLVLIEVFSCLDRSALSLPGLALQCAALHDVLEDTNTSEAELIQEFGSAVASGVAALSKNSQLPKPQRMQDSLDRILKQPAEIAVVKMADRCANLSKPPSTWSPEKIADYAVEAKLILESLGSSNDYFAARLAARISSYIDDFVDPSVG